METKKEQRCCICGKKFSGQGNSPFPLKQSGVCCDKCVSGQVTMARLVFNKFFNDGRRA